MDREPRSEFDVVIVGGGSTGCVVAARLVAPGDRSVLLLEAGPDLQGTLPGEFRDGWSLSRRFDWGYTSEPDEFGNTVPVRRTKMLGGTSWSTRFAVRGSPGDYDEWVALGNPGWSFNEILPYFRRLETDFDFGSESWHGTNGPIPINRFRNLEQTEALAVACEAAQAVGFPVVEDHNRPGAVGLGRMPMSSREGVRVTTSDAYLPTGDTRPNLTIRADSQVSDVILRGTRAAGVRLVDGTTIGADFVVLCAGTYGSPPILMRSGIGPADHLRSLGLSVRVALAGVGANLADHPDVELDCGYQGGSREAPILHAIATFHSQSTSRDHPPDVMLWLTDPTGTPPVFSVDVVLLKPKSRGSVRLRSADPTDPPRIDLPHLQEPADLDRLVEGYKLGWEVASLLPRQLCTASPPAAMRDDRELRAFVRQGAASLPHVVGTCAMGPSPDDGAVVDSSGRVYGVERLLVVDASIMPTVPSGFTHISTIMIAERLAEQMRVDG